MSKVVSLVAPDPPTPPRSSQLNSSNSTKLMWMLRVRWAIDHGENWYKCIRIKSKPRLYYVIRTYSLDVVIMIRQVTSLIRLHLLWYSTSSRHTIKQLSWPEALEPISNLLPIQHSKLFFQSAIYPWSTMSCICCIKKGFQVNCKLKSHKDAIVIFLPIWTSAYVLVYTCMINLSFFHESNYLYSFRHITATLNLSLLETSPLTTSGSSPKPHADVIIIARMSHADSIRKSLNGPYSVDISFKIETIPDDR